MNTITSILKRKHMLLSLIVLCLFSLVAAPCSIAEASSSTVNSTASKDINKSYRSKAEKSIVTTEEIDESDLNESVNSHPYYTVSIAGGSKTLSPEYQDYTYEMCVKYGIEDYYNVILTQMYCESGYNPNAVSSARCYGLMQVGSVHFSHLSSALGLTNIKDPKQNIEAGVYLMAGLINKYGDAQTALVCYHRGEKAARQGIHSDKYSSHIVQLSSNLVEA